MAKASGKKTSKSRSRKVATKKQAPPQTPQTPQPPPEAASDAGPPAFARLHIWQFQAIRDVLFVAAVLAIFWVGYALRAVTVPLLVALLLAYLFEPVVARLAAREHMNRTRAVTALLAVGAVVVVVLLALLMPLVVGQTTRFINEVRDGRMQAKIAQLDRFVPADYREEFRGVIELLPGELDEALFDEEEPEQSDDAAGSPPPRPAGVLAAPTRQQIDAIVDERVASLLEERSAGETASASDLAQLVGRGTGTMLGILGASIQAGLTAFLIPFYFFFFSISYPKVARFGRQLLPERNRSRTLELLGRMDTVVAGFVRGRIVISVIMGLMLAIGWWLCGVPYAVVLGLVIGIFCAVPYLGVIGVPLAVGLLFFEQLGLPSDQRMGWIWIIVWPTVVFAIVQFVEGYGLTPAIAGKATNLDPVTILVAVLAGGSVLGIYGMLLAIPTTACGKILFTDVLMPRVRAWTRGEARDPLPM